MDEAYALGIARKARPLDHLQNRYFNFQKRMMSNASLPIPEPRASTSTSFNSPCVNWLWIIHVRFYYFYTSFNSPRVYAPANQATPSQEMIWSAVALGGAVSTLIMVFAILAEFSYIPMTWNNTSHLTTRLIFLLVILALTAGPCTNHVPFTLATMYVL